MSNTVAPAIFFVTIGTISCSASENVFTKLLKEAVSLAQTRNESGVTQLKMFLVQVSGKGCYVAQRLKDAQGQIKHRIDFFAFENEKPIVKTTEKTEQAFRRVSSLQGHIRRGLLENFQCRYEQDFPIQDCVIMSQGTTKK